MTAVTERRIMQMTSMKRVENFERGIVQDKIGSCYNACRNPTMLKAAKSCWRLKEMKAVADVPIVLVVANPYYNY